VQTDTNINAKDASYSRLLNEGGLDDHGEVAAWLKQQCGSFDATDLMVRVPRSRSLSLCSCSHALQHLRETGERARLDEQRKVSSERQSFEALRARAVEREVAARDAEMRSVAIAAGRAGVRVAGPAAAPPLKPRLLVRPRGGEVGAPSSAKEARRGEAGTVQPVAAEAPAAVSAAPVAATLASLLGSYSDSEG
jgi:hypothetical protein